MGWNLVCLETVKKIVQLKENKGENVRRGGRTIV